MAVLFMRLATLTLALLCVLPHSAEASTGPVHLLMSQLKLEPLAELAPSLQLSAPQLGRAPRAVLRLSPAPASSANQRAQPVSAWPATVRAAGLQSRMYIGDTWSFRGGRELSLHLTPNEGHCAPLMRLTF